MNHYITLQLEKKYTFKRNDVMMTPNLSNSLPQSGMIGLPQTA